MGNEINEYYGVSSTPTDDYLAHYGIKGMKWGVRKAIQRGSERSLARQYKKAQKKLSKLERQANEGAKYARRASRLGKGAALAGGLAIAGTEGVSKGLGYVGKGLNAAGDAVRAYGRRPGKRNILQKASTGVGLTLNKYGKAMTPAADAVKAWGNSNSIGQSVKVAGRKFQNANGGLVAKVTGGKGIVNTTDKLGGVSNNTIARIGAGALGAGLAAGAAYNMHRAKHTDRAAKKAAAFRKEMNKAFAGTKYANAPRTPSKKRRR